MTPHDPASITSDLVSAFDQRSQIIYGPQTNIAGSADGAIILVSTGHQFHLTDAGNLAFHLLDSDFRAGQRNRVPAAFYDGARPNWANIALGHDAKRHLYVRLRSFVEDQTLPAQRMGLILGLAGEGKTTLLMRLAWDLAAAGWPVLWRHSGKAFRTPYPNFQQTYHRPLILCFDQVDDELDLPNLAADLVEYGIPFVILATARFHEWRNAEMEPILRRCLRLHRFGIEQLAEDEVANLLDLLAAHNQLGSLQSLAKTEQIHHFIHHLQANGQLLPALLVARRGVSSFPAVIEDVFLNLRRRPDGEFLCNAYITLCAIHRFGLGLPRLVLVHLLGLEPALVARRLLGPLEGELVEIAGSDSDKLYTRHPLVAEHVVKLSVTNYWCELHYIYQNLFTALGAVLRHTPFDYGLRSLLIKLARKLQVAEPHLLRTLLNRGINDITLPDDTRADAILYETWGVIARSIGEHERARQLFTKATQLDAKRPSIWQAWGVLETRCANVTKARDLFQKGTASDPTHAPLWQAWALLEERQGSIARARELFQQGITADPTHAPSYQAWALLEERQGSIERARELFQQGITADPTHAPSYQAWAMLEERQGSIARARELFQQGITADPTHAPSYQAWALLEERQGSIERARELFQQGITADPTHAPSYQAWALLEERQGSIARARELFQQGITADPTHAPSYQAWAMLEERQGSIERARELFQQGITADPTHAPSYQAWAMLEERQGSIERARELFQQGITADPTHAPSYQAWAMLEERQGSIERARELFAKITDLEPADHFVWHNWALLEMKRLHNYIAAQAVLDKGLTYVHEPKPRAILLCDQGRVLVRLKAYDAARQAFDQALQLDDNNEHTHFFFAAELLEKGRTPVEACTHYQRMLALTQNQEQREKVKAALARLGCKKA